MPENWTEEIIEACINSNTLALALFDQNGKQLYSNRVMRKLTKGKAGDFFFSPTISRLLESTKESPFHGVITFANESAENYSLEVTAVQKNNELLITGEVNVAQLVKQNVSMTLLNQQINNLQRQLIKEKKMLQLANRELKKLNEEKNLFLGAAAHDLRNPVGVCFAYSDLMIENLYELSAEDLMKYLILIRDNAQDSLSLLNELLDISAIESGNTVLKKEKIMYDEWVQQIVETNRIFAEKKQIELKYCSQAQNISIEIDKIKIKQALENLISNAIKYSPAETTIEVRISTEKNNVVTIVSDQGQGIAPYDLEKLFKPFQKTSSKVTGNEKSTGLGLSITKKIITSHGGKIEVTSEIGKGSDFLYSLPVK
ncbi:MAG: HAMP domain-containing histidine kinase [Prolixibacteraceae bacterium]|nr:HAMP domain-containing histidine kinase [Prolixibacteraceae bacterium]